MTNKPASPKPQIDTNEKPNDQEKTPLRKEPIDDIDDIDDDIYDISNENFTR